MNRSPKKVLMFDDDSTYASILKRQAKAMKVEAIVCNTMDEFCIKALEGHFDVALIDYHLEHFKGDTVSKIIENKPVVMMSMDEGMLQRKNDWPKGIVGFISKHEGPHNVIDMALSHAA